MNKDETKVNFIRCFISADIPEEVKAYLTALQAEVGPISGVNFVPKENLHVTLAFLGEISEDVLSDVIARAEDIAGSISPFACSLGNIEAVPYHLPRMIWVTVSDNGRLKEIHGALNQSLNIQGREFSGHITIARIKNAGAARMVNHKLDEIQLTRMDFQVRSISVMESRLTAQGAVYSVVRAICLRSK